MATDNPQYSGHDLEALFDLRNYQKWVVAFFAPYLHGDVVEFGAGIGAVSQWLLPHVARIDLVEPSQNLLQVLGERFRDDPRVRTFAQSLEAYAADRAPASVDAAVMVNLLEHIEDDAGALRSVLALLRPEGHLLLFVPAMPSLYSALDKACGHYRRYSRRSLKRVVSDAGYDIVCLRYFDMPGILPWWLINTIGGKKEFDPGMARLYDRLCVPIARALETLLPPPLGKNLVLIARRPPS